MSVSGDGPRTVRGAGLGGAGRSALAVLAAWLAVQDDELYLSDPAEASDNVSDQ